MTAIAWGDQAFIESYRPIYNQCLSLSFHHESVTYEWEGEFKQRLDEFKQWVAIHNKCFHFYLEHESVTYEWEGEFK
jgi:hypothetical protein